MDVSVLIIVVCGARAGALVVVFLVFGRREDAFRMDIGGASPRAAGGSAASSDKTLSTRIAGFGVLVGGALATLLARTASMQLLSGDEYASQADSNRTRTIYTRAPRGRILDRNGVEIVTNRPSLTVVAEPDVVDDEVEMHLLANLIGMPYQAVRRKVQDTTDGAQALRAVSVDVSRRVAAYIGEHPSSFEGVSIQQRTQRYYPQGSLAAHVVGYTGTVTSEQLAASESGETSVTYRSGDVVGQSGVEYEYESALQGIRGEQTVYVDANGDVLDYSTTIEPQAGSDVLLTIDATVQAAAEESLVRVMEQVRESGYAATGASVVALDCTNGEVLAMASAPTFEPSMFVGGISTADWESLQSEDAHYPLMNRAISGQYPSGSVIKALSTFAALDYGIVSQDASYYCSGTWTGFGTAYAMNCWVTTGHGTVDLVSGITYSCDVVYYEIGKGFYYSDDDEGLQETFRRYGLGSYTGIDLPSESMGRVPDAEWKWSYWSSSTDEARRWQGGDNCNLAIGQGDLLVTCLQIADAYCGIANRGQIWKPHVLKSVRSRIGTGSVVEYAPEVILEPNEESDVARDLVLQGLKGVIYEESETQATHWTNLSETVAGKTGTAEQSEGDPIGWFVAFVPADDPKYVVCGNMDRVLQGADSAMYVVRDVIGAIYGEPDTSTVANTNSDR